MRFPKLTNWRMRLGATRVRTGAMAALAALAVLLVAIGYYAVAPRDPDLRRDDARRTLTFRAQVLRAQLLPVLGAPKTFARRLAQGQDAATAAQWLLEAHPLVGAVSLTPQTGAASEFVRVRGDEADARGTTPEATSGNIAAPDSARPAGAIALSPAGALTLAVVADALILSQRFDVPGQTGPQPWASLGLRIDAAAIDAALHLDALRGQGYGVSLDYLAVDGGAQTPLRGIDDRFGEAVEILRERIDIAPGEVLVLSLSLPARGVAAAVNLPEAVFVLLGAAMAAALVALMLRYPAAMSRQIRQRTEQLADEKRQLQSEIEFRKQAEHQLEQSYALLDSIFEHIPSMIVIRRVADGRITRINRAAERLLGMSKEFIVGRNNSEIFPEAQARRHDAADARALASGEVVEMPEELIHAGDGAVNWLALRKIALTDPDGSVGHILELGENISKRKHLDEALTENVHFLEQLLGAIPNPVFFKGVDGMYLGVNKAFEAFYGLRSEQIVGKSVYDIAPAELARTYAEADQALLAEGGTQIYEARVSPAQGDDKDVLFYKAVFSSSRGEPGGIVGVILDISERKDAERRLLQVNRLLAVLNETNQAIVRRNDCRTLFERTVSVLERVGEFSLAWIYTTHADLPVCVATGTRNELIEKINRRLRADPAPPSLALAGVSVHRHDAASFHPHLAQFDPGLDAAAGTAGAATRGLAHLPLRLDGKPVGGICILAASADIADAKVQALLVSLADNLSFAVDASLREQASRRAEQKLLLAAHVFDNSAEGIMITDADNRILMVNRRFSEITGYSADDVIGGTPDILNSGQQDDTFYQNMWRALSNRGEWHGEIRNRRKDGEIIVEWLNASVVKNEAGEISNFVGVFSEITVHKKIRKRMQFLAHYDVLTSLPNRVLFSDRLEQSLIAARRNGRMTAMLAVDLDHFGQVNARFGHATGDLMLQEASRRLLAAVPDGASVSRLGSDEFAVVLPDIDSIDQAANAAERVIQALGARIPLGSSEVNMTASVGISVFPRDGGDAETLSRCADAAMYQAAEAGGNTCRFYGALGHGAVSESMKLRERLHRAIERNELKVYYEPLVSAGSGRIVGAQALLRWFRPESGFVSPQIFVPLLEDSGLVVKIGEQVLNTALADLALWQAAGAADFCVSVNLANAQIVDAHFLPMVGQALAASGLPASALRVEIAEAVLMQDAAQKLLIAQKLAALGVRITVDNFGTGFSSLHYLHRFPVDNLKIDRSFVLDLPTDAEAAALTRSVVAMARSRGIETIAEGVETQAQIDFLVAAGCDLLQGYSFSQALAADEFSALLARNVIYPQVPDADKGATRMHLVRGTAQRA